MRSLSPRIWVTISEECALLSCYSDQDRGFPDVASRADRYRVVLGVRLVTSGEQAPALRCHIQDGYVSCIPTDVMHCAPDSGRIDLPVERLPNLA